ncbi:hypothetical protein MVEN_01225300 [Mycena venus]|uniref:Uncharacterized protein n=1 Tax=Mycena venus TaxID=2733690 RepID=A0A8H6Y3F8_9AGAR|nr:hypothetical protein MVEN_01225300 [Mycena venus]
MLLLRLLSIGLFALLVASQDDGQPSDGVLNNMDGKTPCDMKEMFVQSCLPPQARDDNDPDTTPTPPPSPTPCICTNVFFNLWSACVYITHGNASLPVCESLQQNCTQASIDITTKPFQSNASYPKWVYMDLPANGTFNLAAAVESADGSQSHKWTTIQVVVPIIVFVVVVALGVGFFLYRRRRHANRQRPWMQTTGNRPRFHFPTLSSLQRVRELDRSSSWSIEEREEGLQEYQFVSYPSSLQGSRASGHVRLSSSSSGTLPGPPPLKIPSEKNKAPVWTWPGKSIWKGPLQSVQQLGDSIPRPWRATKRVAVKNIPGYRKFRVDGADSDSPLSQRPHAQSLLGHPERSRTNLHNETIFERENEDSDSDEEGLPLIAQEHSRSNHDAEPPANAARMISPPSGRESPGESNSSQRTARQKVPPASSPPRIPLPLPPPTPTQRPPPSPASSQQQPISVDISLGTSPVCSSSSCASTTDVLSFSSISGFSSVGGTKSTTTPQPPASSDLPTSTTSHLPQALP